MNGCSALILIVVQTPVSGYLVNEEEPLKLEQVWGKFHDACILSYTVLTIVFIVIAEKYVSPARNILLSIGELSSMTR